MAVELINVGKIANDGTGDDLREAFLKINRNFEELDLRDDEQTTASNLGSSGVGVFAQKLNYDLQFKRLIAGQDITLSSNDQSITIDANGGLKTILLIGDNGNKTLEGVTHLNINGGNDIATRIEQDSLIIDYTGPKSLLEDTNPTLSGTLNANFQDIINVNTITASEFNGSFVGNLTGNVYGIDIRQFTGIFDTNGFDFGEITQTITSIYEWLISDIDIDFGTFDNPNPRTIDLGLID